MYVKKFTSVQMVNLELFYDNRSVNWVETQKSLIYAIISKLQVFMHLRKI